jgi:hypothetical protein
MASSIKCSDVVEKFDGTGDFSEWIRKVELVAKLQGLTALENFVPLFLTSGAFTVYESFDNAVKGSYKKLRSALIKAFSTDCFQAYGEFSRRRLLEGEAVEVYLADLKRLAGLISNGKDSEWIKCAFVVGLPDVVRRQLVASCSMERMDIPEIVDKVRAMLKSRFEVSAVAIDRERFRNNGKPDSKEVSTKSMKCFTCNEGHRAQECRNKKLSVRQCF